MAFTSIEIIALILIIVSVIKLLVLLISPKSWMGFAKKVWTSPVVAAIVCFLLAALVLYYLVQEITIVQILAVMAFMALFIAIGFVGHVKDLFKKYDKKIKTKTLWKNGMWLYALLWLALIVWGAIVLFV